MEYFSFGGILNDIGNRQNHPSSFKREKITLAHVTEYSFRKKIYHQLLNTKKPIANSRQIIFQKKKD